MPGSSYSNQGTVPAHEIEEAIEEGRRTGYAEGLRRGLAEAEASAALLEQDYLERVNSVISALMQAKDSLDQHQSTDMELIADELGRATFMMIETILGHELRLDPSPVMSAIRRAFREAPASKTATIRLHPGDAAAIGVGETPNQELLTAANGRGLTFIADSSTQMGGAIIEIGATTIDAQLSTAMDRVGRVLRSDDDPVTE
jgi:flagellar biosynthesis/type III secretory pathway protein FliH